MKLMTHIVAGYPTMKECEKIALTMAESGVSYIEIQFPFSDPIADGPTIMEANGKALSNGVTTKRCFDLVERLREKTDVPLLAMTYYNIAFRYGLEKFCRKAQKAGLYGLIIPDIPIDEEKYDHYLKICKKYSLHPIQVISPITPDERLKKIAKAASGFVYCVSSFGTTGERGKLNSDLRGYMNRVKKFIKTPLALGFGISNGEQAATASKYADIVVIGSKIINVHREKGVAGVKNFLRNCCKINSPI